MLSKEQYSVFESALTKVVEDVLIPPKNVDENADEILEGLEQGIYFVEQGKWEGTEEQLYLYDRRKLSDHIDDLFALCRMLPWLHRPTEKHGGTISAFDLLVDYRECPEFDGYLMVLLANHFANLLKATNIAQIHPAVYKEHKSFLIVLNPQYREYVNEA